MMGHQGMRYSLVSREVIADSIEVVAGGMNHDGSLLGGCDKNMPGCLMAMARLNVPSVFVYGGCILPGRRRARTSTSSPSSRRSAPARPASSTREGVHAHRVRGVPRRRLLRRHVHRQHHVQRHRGDGHVAALRRQLPRRRPPPRSARPSSPARRRRRADRPGHQAARHHHAQVAGERLHLRAGPGRLDQRRAAPDGDRPRGRGRLDAGRLRPARRQGAAPGRPQAGRPLRHERPAPRRRHPGRACAPCSTPASCTATASP